MHSGRIGGTLVSAALVMALGLPTSVFASTSPDPSPSPCALGTSTVIAGTPLELSGSLAGPNDSVSLTAFKDKSDIRDGTVAQLNGSWRGVILFGAADGGSWQIDIVAGDVECMSPITVLLPAGVVAPPTRAPVDDGSLDQPQSGIDGSTILTVAASAAAALVVASWLVLAITAVLAFGAGARPLRRQPVRWLAQGAAFIGVLGAMVGVGLFVYFADSMSHFDSGIPPDQRALLDIGTWGLAIVGSVVGTIAARRVGKGSPADRR